MVTGGLFLVLSHWNYQSLLTIKDVNRFPITDLDRSLRLQEVEAARISRQWAHEGGKVVRPTYRPPLPPQEIFLVLISVKG